VNREKTVASVHQPIFVWFFFTAFSLAALAWAAISGAGYRFLRNQVGLEKDQIGTFLMW
jgi:hypothetical protein